MVSFSAKGPRIQIEISAEMADKLEELQLLGAFQTRTEMFNNALTLLEWAVSEAKKGHTIGAIDAKEDLYIELEMPFLGRNAASSRLR